MPANAVDEWPEGNDFLPSSIADASLYVPYLLVKHNTQKYSKPTQYKA